MPRQEEPVPVCAFESSSSAQEESESGRINLRWAVFTLAAAAALAGSAPFVISSLGISIVSHHSVGLLLCASLFNSVLLCAILHNCDSLFSTENERLKKKKKGTCGARGSRRVDSSSSTSREVLFLMHSTAA